MNRTVLGFGFALLLIVALVTLVAIPGSHSKSPTLNALSVPIGATVECVQRAYHTTNPAAGNKSMEKLLTHYKGWQLVMNTITATRQDRVFILMCFTR